MADNDTLPRKASKFLFDVNNFDEPEGPDPDAPPPPPVFSLEDMDAEKLQAHEHGRKAGLAEAEASRERFVTGLLQALSETLANLFETEKRRNAQYEAESVLLTRAVFEKLFPALNERHGLDEVQTVIASVLENHRHQQEIVIEVNSEFLPDIKAIAENLRMRMHGAGNIQVVDNDRLQRGDCRMSWNDGGAERNATALAAEIRKKLDEALAGRPLLQDNREQNAADAQGEPNG